ncbi:MAG TPA: long-chain fatty acid--CoA ligase [Geobacteraceae bacterium]
MTATTDYIDPSTARTLPGLFRERVRRSPGARAYLRFAPDESCCADITWGEVETLAGRWQQALLREKLQPGDRVAVMLKNCLEWVLFDMAALGLGLVTVPLYVNDRPENFAFILKETDARLLLIEGVAQWQRIEEVSDRLAFIERIVTLERVCSPNSYSDVYQGGEKEATQAYTGVRRGDSDAANAGRRLKTNSDGCDPRLVELDQWLPGMPGEYAVRECPPAELATIVYTSGTTGHPKGVMLSHANILANAFAGLQRVPVYPDDLFLSFLPLSHSFERTAGYYIPMMAGARVAHVRAVEKLPEDLVAVRPTVLVSVPRIYERIHKKIMTELDDKPSLVRRIFFLAVRAGWQHFLRRQGRAGWSPLFLLRPLLNRLVAKRLLAGLGGRVRLAVSGGAPLAPPIARVFIGLGLNLLQGYGLTETSPVVSVNTSEDNLPATVGRPYPGVEVRTADNGELLVRGESVMLGYWRNDAATATAIDRDGWFHTGDLARIDEQGHIVITGRLKEILVLATGEKVPPEDLELAIAVNPLFEQVMVMGEGKPYLAALVALNERQWKKLAARLAIPPGRDDLLASERVEQALLAEIARRIIRFPGYAQIRRVHATLSPWTVQEGLITATLKLRRKELMARFANEIEALYAGH